jgi:hypothetical protein
MRLGIHRSRPVWQVGLLALQLCACQIEPLGTYGLPSLSAADADADGGVPDDASTSPPPEPELDSGTALREDGQRCADDGACASAHCNSGLCCAEGDCCRRAADCAGDSEVALICEHPEDCQGSRGRYACEKNRCRIRDLEPDDSACTDEVRVDRCGFYRSVYCNGESEQSRPLCPEACSDNTDCDPTAVCTDGVCDAPGAVSESVPEAECEIDRDCDSGLCTGGRCCRPESEDCPSERSGSEDEQRRCLDVFTRNAIPETCRQCACERCAVSMLACLDSGDQSRNARCRSVTTCGYFAGCLGNCADSDSGCFGERCYCGQGNSSCTVPYGPCVESITVAGETGDPEQLLERARDSAYPLYYATQFTQCMSDECGSECAAPTFAPSPF